MTNKTADDQAFESGFSSILSETPNVELDSSLPNEQDEQSAKAQDDQSESKAEEQKGPEEDPFASLSPAVREQLAALIQWKSSAETQLESYKRQLGQIPALQSRIDRLSSTPPRASEAAPAAPRKFEKVEKLRTELPEIAEALDELASSLEPMRAAKAEPQEEAQPGGQQEAKPLERVQSEHDPIADQMEALNELRPGWDKQFLGADFTLWLERQSPEYQAQVKGARKASVVLQALKLHDEFTQKTQTKQVQTQERTNRMAAAASPQGAGRRPTRVAPDDEDAAFMAGFKAIRG